ncbi:MAG: hypothetical protein R3E96_06380 [Planctomycetota bacterium]
MANEIAKDNSFALVAAYRSNESPMYEFFPVLARKREAGAIVRAEFQSDLASHLVEDKPGFFR